MTQIVRGDGVAALRQLDAGSMDVIFLDPPFDSALLKSAVPHSNKSNSNKSNPAPFNSTLFDAALLAAGRAVASTGFVYLEAPLKWTDAQLTSAGLVLHRHLKAGAVHAHLLKRAEA